MSTLPVSNPTILQIIPELDTGGAELSTIEIAQAVASAGGRALVVSEGGRLASHLAEVGGELIFFPAATKNPLRMLYNGERLAMVIRKRNVDLVHARSRAPAWSALYAARKAGVPFVTTYHGAYNENGPFKKLYNSVMARSDIVIANSRYTANLVEQRYKTESNKIRIIYRGVDGKHYDPANVSDDDVAKLRSAWGVEAGRRIVLHPARLTGWKGQAVVIEAARLLKERGQLDDTVFVLAGDSQGRTRYLDQLREQISSSGLTDHIKLPGHVSDMRTAFASAHAAIVASIEPEAFGRTATEAQVMGCPVIATNIGAPPETVLSEPVVEASAATGWLIEPNSPETLARALSQALNLTPDKRDEVGKRAREHVLESFTLDLMKKQTLGVYDELLGTHMCADYGRKSGG